ncbi:hypothetical protein ACN9MZ_28995 [Pseudoduganella sp. S-14]|jgi:hypothetical protein|uniref:hypothetical protein n=1 Tax=Pseudoduganella sp. S-14 TaxID=3404065 RepID=UPI003CE7708D
MNEINPRVCVGNIPFNASCQTLIMAGYVEHIEGYDPVTGWRTFKKNDEMEIYVRDDAVVCIACFRECAINGVSLIGMTPSELIAQVGDPDEIGEAIWVSDDAQQTPYEYFSLGLQVWIESCRVISVFCNAIY